MNEDFIDGHRYGDSRQPLFSFMFLPVMKIRLQLHDAIYRPDSFVLMLSYCANLKAIRYESTSLNRIVADKSHRVIVRFISPIVLYWCYVIVRI